MKYDAIIIGAGVGGLTCGAALAFFGKKILIVEKHSLIGGFIQGFHRKKWHWNIGTHYIGKLDPSNPIYHIFHTLTEGKIEYKDMGSCIDRIIMKTFAFDIISNNGGKFMKKLQCEFPDEKEAIASYFGLLYHVESNSVYLLIPKMSTGFKKHISYCLARIKFAKLWNTTLGDILDSYFKDEKLKTILAYHCGKVILPPEELSFLTYAIAQNSFLNGAEYPAGSGESISGALSDLVLSRGGEIRTRTGVKQLLFENRKLRGVLLETGEEIRCNTIISNIGIRETAERLTPKPYVSRRQNRVMKAFKSTDSYVTLYIGLEGDLSRFNIENCNYRRMEEHPYDFSRNPLVPDWTPNCLTVTFPSLRDEHHDDPNHHTAEIMVPVQYRYFQQWCSGKPGKRDSDYKAHKETMTRRLLDIFNQLFPGIEDNVAYANLSTPVTYEFYTGHYRGSAYGLAHTVGRLTSLDLHPVSDIDGLYYTGSDAFSPGIMGCFLGGLFTASAILKKNLFKELAQPRSEST